MKHDDFTEFINVVSKFSILVSELTDSETRELIIYRLKFGSNHEAFFKSLDGLSAINSTHPNPDIWLKVKQIYSNLYQCINLGHREIFKAFEIDLARIASQLELDKLLNYDTLSQKDFYNMLTMPKEKFEDFINQLQKLKKDPEYSSADMDEDGNIIYY